MAKGFRHLTYEDRCQIKILLKSGFPIASIASKIGFHRSSIYREISRNKGKAGYRYKQAHSFAMRRLEKTHAKSHRGCRLVEFKLVEELLTRYQWSPEQISGRLLRTHKIRISHETIYQHIWKDKKKGGKLHIHLRHGRKLYLKRSGSYKGRGRIPGRIDISSRPKIVDKKKRIGDWEIDTVLGKGQKASIVSIVDRKSKYAILRHVVGKKSFDINQTTTKALKPIAKLVHTITSDNGREFVRHEELSKALNAKFYFAKPYHSWERGLNEHTNGLIRQYFPKNLDLRNVKPGEVLMVQSLLNNRPRKVLGYKTPAEVFSKALDRITGVAFQT